jgi:hypothetical protein
VELWRARPDEEPHDIVSDFDVCSSHPCRGVEVNACYSGIRMGVIGDERVQMYANLMVRVWYDPAPRGKMRMLQNKTLTYQKLQKQ